MGLKKIISVILTFMVFGCFGLISQAQEIDPFYENLLNQAEMKVKEARYNEAIQELNIALFGLGESVSHQAKANALMAICFYYTKDLDASRRYLTRAGVLHGNERLEGLPLDPQLKETLINIQAALNTTRIGSRDAASESVSDLEKAIASDSKNIEAYYRLYELHRAQKRMKPAEDALKELIKKNPAEINGYFLLGNHYYRQRKYKDAEKSFFRIIELPKSMESDEATLEMSRAYYILSLYFRGDKKKSIRTAESHLELFTPQKIQVLALDTIDKERLKFIILEAAKQKQPDKKESLPVPEKKDTIPTPKSAAESEEEEGAGGGSKNATVIDPADIKQRQKSLESKIKADRKNIPLYYELYEIHRQNKEFNKAKDTIKTLVKNNPNDTQARLLLIKLEYMQKKYKDAFKNCQEILEAEDTSQITRELSLKSMLYATLSCRHMKKMKDAENYFRFLQRVENEELNRILEEEGLRQEWEGLKESNQPALSRIPPCPATMLQS